MEDKNRPTRIEEGRQPTPIFPPPGDHGAGKQPVKYVPPPPPPKKG